MCVYVYCHISQSTSEVFAASGGVASASSGQDPGSWKAVAIELEYVCVCASKTIELCPNGAKNSPVMDFTPLTSALSPYDLCSPCI